MNRDKLFKIVKKAEKKIRKDCLKYKCSECKYRDEEKNCIFTDITSWWLKYGRKE